MCSCIIINIGKWYLSDKIIKVLFYFIVDLYVLDRYIIKWYILISSINFYIEKFK